MLTKILLPVWACAWVLVTIVAATSIVTKDDHRPKQDEFFETNPRPSPVQIPVAPAPSATTGHLDIVV